MDCAPTQRTPPAVSQERKKNANKKPPNTRFELFLLDEGQEKVEEKAETRMYNTHTHLPIHAAPANLALPPS